MSLQGYAERQCALSLSLKELSTLIQRLSQLQPTSTSQAEGLGSTATEQDSLPADEIRADLSSDIQVNLRQFEEDLELLKFDLEDVSPGLTGRTGGIRRGYAGAEARREAQTDSETARLKSGCIMLEEDMKSSVTLARVLRELA